MIVNMADKKTYPEIAERLRMLRTAFSDDNRSVWAGRHGFNVSQYINWELGIRRIPIDASVQLVQLYGITLDWIYLGRMDGLSEAARRTLMASPRT